MFFLELLLIQILAYTSQQVLLHSIKNAGLFRPHRWVKKMYKQVKFTQKIFYLTQICVETSQQLKL